LRCTLGLKFVPVLPPVGRDKAVPIETFRFVYIFFKELPSELLLRDDILDESDFLDFSFLERCDAVFSCGLSTDYRESTYD
jgi:hypothetical protein